ncbi:hypothetical protein N9Q05_02370 [bacterium]|nr:hypothetical protein [bacterium]
MPSKKYRLPKIDHNTSKEMLKPKPEEVALPSIFNPNIESSEGLFDYLLCNDIDVYFSDSDSEVETITGVEEKKTAVGVSGSHRVQAWNSDSDRSLTQTPSSRNNVAVQKKTTLTLLPLEIRKGTDSSLATTSSTGHSPVPLNGSSRTSSRTSSRITSSTTSILSTRNSPLPAITSATSTNSATNLLSRSPYIMHRRTHSRTQIQPINTEELNQKLLSLESELVQKFSQLEEGKKSSEQDEHEWMENYAKLYGLDG